MQVRIRLILDDIQDLRSLFGKPEKLMKTLLKEVRSAPVPRADRLETFIFKFWYYGKATVRPFGSLTTERPPEYPDAGAEASRKAAAKLQAGLGPVQAGLEWIVR